MDYQTMNLEIDYMGSSGIVLSTEQKTALEISLVLLKNNEKLDNVHFWGRIRGINSDYFIAKGFGVDYFGQKRFYYSKDCMNWGLLNPPSKKIMKEFKYFTGQFTGEPSHIFEAKMITTSEQTANKMVSMKEEDKLACTITSIENDVLIVPRKAFIKDLSGKVLKNDKFSGLQLTEASQLYSYMHLRKDCKNDNSVLRGDFEMSIDFMDTIEDDIPKKSWSLQVERGGRLVVLKSLLWLGYVFYHVVGTNQFGSLYFGSGQMNIDLPFML